MDHAILRFYRSALPNIAAECRPHTRRSSGHGTVLLLPDPPELQRHVADVADHLGARITPLRGMHHCWMAEDPTRIARTPAEFWRALDEEHLSPPPPAL